MQQVMEEKGRRENREGAERDRKRERGEKKETEAASLREMEKKETQAGS